MVCEKEPVSHQLLTAAKLSKWLWLRRESCLVAGITLLATDATEFNEACHSD